MLRPGLQSAWQSPHDSLKYNITVTGRPGFDLIASRSLIQFYTPDSGWSITHKLNALLIQDSTGALGRVLPNCGDNNAIVIFNTGCQTVLLFRRTGTMPYRALYAYRGSDFSYYELPTSKKIIKSVNHFILLSDSRGLKRSMF